MDKILPLLCYSLSLLTLQVPKGVNSSCYSVIVLMTNESERGHFTDAPTSSHSKKPGVTAYAVCLKGTGNATGLPEHLKCHQLGKPNFWVRVFYI